MNHIHLKKVLSLTLHELTQSDFMLLNPRITPHRITVIPFYPVIESKEQENDLLTTNGRDCNPLAMVQKRMIQNCKETPSSDLEILIAYAQKFDWKCSYSVKKRSNDLLIEHPTLSKLKPPGMYLLCCCVLSKSKKITTLLS